MKQVLITLAIVALIAVIAIVLALDGQPKTSDTTEVGSAEASSAEASEVEAPAGN
ncbi:hypothetical protein [Lujinxingia sediminis]|uniref:hypothetical protein n=1 Tax=Lujinxingia sediminis TaxID=2480984 RepID=UPI0013E3E572|nr:hypothetical protein [Lujinxingia sediminis]